MPWRLLPDDGAEPSLVPESSSVLVIRSLMAKCVSDSRNENYLGIVPLTNGNFHFHLEWRRKIPDQENQDQGAEEGRRGCKP